METNAKPARENFSLVNVKFKDGTICTTYQLREEKNNIVYNSKYTVKSERLITSDLNNALLNLCPVAINVLKSNCYFNMLSNDMDVYIKEIILSGKGNKASVIITFMIPVLDYKYAIVKTPRLFYKKGLLDFETELQDKINILEDEVYKYLFEEKYAELETL